MLQVVHTCQHFVLWLNFIFCPSEYLMGVQHRAEKDSHLGLNEVKITDFPSRKYFKVAQNSFQPLYYLDGSL